MLQKKTEVEIQFMEIEVYVNFVKLKISRNEY